MPKTARSTSLRSGVSGRARSKSVHWLHKLFLFCILTPLVLFILFFAWYIFTSQKTDEHQATLQPFYNTKDIPAGKPGDLIRKEPMNITVPYGNAYRILYHSELEDGTPTVVSGMIFIPNLSVQGDDLDVESDHNDRPIVAWAHGTIGMGTSCAPSRQSDPLPPIGGLSEMLQAGFIVTATDYYGLGTQGTEHYLLGDDEARDVLNSVRAARQFPQTQTGDHFALWGHSQGGHAVLFAANQAKIYAPELTLIAVSAGAPAAELPSLMQQSYKGTVPWIIGPEIAVAWPLAYKDLPLSGVLSDTGTKNYQRLAMECVQMASIEGIIRNKFAESFFQKDPNDNPVWAKALQDQTPQPVLETPIFIAQSLSDTVVLPNTTALYVKKSCDAGANLTIDWLADVTHMETAKVAGPTVASWLEERFIGIPAEPTCDQPLPIAPARDPR